MSERVKQDASEIPQIAPLSGNPPAIAKETLHLGEAGARGSIRSFAQSRPLPLLRTTAAFAHDKADARDAGRTHPARSRQFAPAGHGIDKLMANLESNGPGGPLA